MVMRRRITSGEETRDRNKDFIIPKYGCKRISLQHRARRTLSEINRIVRPAVPWINLAHVGKKKIGYCRLQGRHMLGVVEGNNRLCLATAMDERINDPMLLKVWSDAAKLFHGQIENLRIV